MVRSPYQVATTPGSDQIFQNLDSRASPEDVSSFVSDFSANARFADRRAKREQLFGLDLFSSRMN
jgi:hypothetical protein